MESFWVKVKKTKTCWVWTARKTKFGYGVFRLQKKYIPAHRAAWILTNGPIPSAPGRGLFVCHKCDNRPCVRPSHLFLGTNQDNMDDMVKKGRCIRAKGSKNGRAKITEKQAKMIREEYPLLKSTRKLAKKYGISRSAIQFILHRKHWRHV